MADGDVTVFLARRVITMNPARPYATAVAVRDGRILSVGDLDEMSGWLAEGRHRVDRAFEHSVILPGFIDAHMHALSLGQSWQSIEAGLPSSFGFPAAVHPRDPDTLFLLPLNGDIRGRYVPDGKAAVWKTSDGGATWQAKRHGLPQENVFYGVLRQAMATDRLDPAGVYFGTSSGALYASADEGESWTAVAEHLPTILSVETMVVDG